MFLDPGDHILIMDLDTAPLTFDEKAKISQIGINTLYYFGSIRWDVMQPTEKSPINFDRLDRYIWDADSLGMKVLIPFFYQTPPWKNEDWYYNRKLYGIPNYCNPQAGCDIDEFAKQIISRYGPKVAQVVYAMPAAGEFPVHFDPTSGLLPFPNSVLVDFVVARQKVLAAQCGEVWTAFHCYTRPVWWHDLYSVLQREFPDCNHYGIQFTYYIHDSKIIYDWIADTSARYGIKYFGGSEYCQGLRKHTPLCIAQKQQGFITAPIHPFQTNHRLETWMLDELSWANEQLRGANA